MWAFTEANHNIDGVVRAALDLNLMRSMTLLGLVLCATQQNPLQPNKILTPGAQIQTLALSTTNGSVLLKRAATLMVPSLEPVANVSPSWLNCSRMMSCLCPAAGVRHTGSGACSQVFTVTALFSSPGSTDPEPLFSECWLTALRLSQLQM